MNNNQEKNNKFVKPLKNCLKGKIQVPADKSISHRAAMFLALGNGSAFVENFSKGADCQSTLSVLKGLGLEIINKDNGILINSKGFTEPQNILDAGNSGTTIRLMSGILAGQNFYSVLTGDESLRKRPMSRVINPLTQMGAQIYARENNSKAPITIKGSKLHALDYNSNISSAQVKSCILLAGLFAEGTTSFTEPFKSRDHTERLLKYLDADITINKNTVSIKPSTLSMKNLTIFGDISSAAFFLVAGAIVPDSEITIQNVGLNPTRTGIIDVLKLMGAEIKILNLREEYGEEVGDVKVTYSNLKAITIEKDLVPRVIDELPIIAVMATQAEGTTIIKDASDLRNKESDRIKAVCSELNKLGASIEETEDGFIIHGKTNLTGGCTIETYHDHRIAMSAYIAGLICQKPIEISEFNWVNISFPEFEEVFEQLKI